MFIKCLQLFRRNKDYERIMRLLVMSVYKKINFKYYIPKMYKINGPLLAASIWSTQEEPSLTKKEVLLAKVDALFDEGKYRDIYVLLCTYKDTNEIEILWRLSRALYKMSETASEVEAKKLINEGYEIISRAMEIDSNHFAVHKWMAVLLDKKSEYVGIKERIKQLENVKKHMIRASELNPNDATMYYMLGQWCFSVAELSWYQRKLAATFFANPPESTYEDALKYFQQAESIEPMFYSYNLLMIGKAYLRLKNKEEAKKYLRSAADYTAKTKEDHNVKQEAMNLLSKI